MTKAKKMALCGVLAALAVTVMVLGGMIPMATYCAPVLAAAMLIPIVEGCGRRMAWVWFGAVGVLVCLVCADIEAALLFVCMGHYPILRKDLDRIPLKGLRLLAKLLVFNLALAVMAAILAVLLGLEQLLREYTGDGLWLFVLTWFMGNCVFLLTDQVLRRLTVLLYRGRGRRRP